jgi:hypothetical protein
MARLNFRLKPSEETKQHTSFIKSLDESEVNPANPAKVDETLVDPVNDNHVGKHVSFVALHIRQHSVTLGDHPCCTLGLPVALDWNIEKEFSMNLDDYESTRERRKSRLELRLSSDDRLELLSDVSEQEIKRANRKLQRERQQCRNPCDRTFFDQVEPQILIARGSSE